MENVASISKNNEKSCCCFHTHNKIKGGQRTVIFRIDEDSTLNNFLYLQEPSLITGWSTSLQGVDETDQSILGQA